MAVPQVDVASRQLAWNDMSHCVRGDTHNSAADIAYIMAQEPDCHQAAGDKSLIFERQSGD